MATLKVRELGDYIREQRNSSQISLRQLARLAGVSNPYLSQIERGLRKPSAEILQQIAKALRISAEALYVQAGILEERDGDSDVPASILGDTTITERQKAVLLEIYDSFRKENESVAATADVDAPAPLVKPALPKTAVKPATAPTAKPAAPKKTAARRTPKSTAPAADAGDADGPRSTDDTVATG
jgi:transcriptional regulator with XRE-family HTH domain